MAGIISGLLGLFGCGKGTKSERTVADIYQGLRQQVLTLDPLSLGLDPSASNRVWGVLMETGYPEAVASLVVIADGTVSLYFSNGGGIIGVGMGFAAVPLAGAFMGWPGIITPSAVLLSLGVALATGLLFGIAPAVRAARLDPAEALRRG